LKPTFKNIQPRANPPEFDSNRSEIAIPAEKLILTTKPALVNRMIVVCINGRFNVLGRSCTFANFCLAKGGNMNGNIDNFAGRGEVIVMAGAGVSAGKPSALPGWKPLNSAIAYALCMRIESSINRAGWLSGLMPEIDGQRMTDRFPPDYQAQIIEEVCGDRYFRGLQALDVDVINAGHDGIACLAAAGALKAIVTTNFDRLIERALDQRNVQYTVSHDDAGYIEMAGRLKAKKNEILPIIKIHGCVSDHHSMIDTLKQRKQGRSQHLQTCLDELHAGSWLYLGFSAADLETDPEYLGLVKGAEQSAGATYIEYPGSIKEKKGSVKLGNGAKLLVDAYFGRAQVIVEYIDLYLAQVGRTLDAPEQTPVADDVSSGAEQFEVKLHAWANDLSPSAAGLCLAAILEAIGQAEPAIRILDRLVRHDLHNEHGTADFRSLQLQYGRLGAAWGRFISVPDLNGAASNASVETVQSLMHLQGSELEFAGVSWLACAHLWLNQGQKATEIAIALLTGFLEGHWGPLTPRNDEEAVDAWLSALQVLILNADEKTGLLILGTADKAFELARLRGDVVRMARVVALKGALLATTKEDVPKIIEQHKSEFDDAARVQDGFALGMRSLALGRWYVGPEGIALARKTDSMTVAQMALNHLNEAIGYFQNQGMDPWVLFALLQKAKAHMDMRQIDEGQNCINEVSQGLERFPIFESHVQEAVGQFRMMMGDKGAIENFLAAKEAAEHSGLLGQLKGLQFYIDQVR
jgi:hypothetical protein